MAVSWKGAEYLEIRCTKTSVCRSQLIILLLDFEMLAEKNTHHTTGMVECGARVCFCFATKLSHNHTEIACHMYITNENVYSIIEHVDEMRSIRMATR